MDVRDRQVLPESPSEALAERYDFRRHHVDVLCGGFPCQDISNAGKRAGISGERSGLWRFMVRAIRVVRPKYAIVENVAALLNRGMGTVLGDLAESGYDSEWDCLPASAFGANHYRERIFIVANSAGDSIKSSAHSEKKSQIRQQLRGCKSGRILGGEIPRIYRTEDQPSIVEMDDDVSTWAHEVSSYGNAVVPQIVEWIGRRLLTERGGK